MRWKTEGQHDQKLRAHETQHWGPTRPDTEGPHDPTLRTHETEHWGPTKPNHLPGAGQLHSGTDNMHAGLPVPRISAISFMTIKWVKVTQCLTPRSHGLYKFSRPEYWRGYPFPSQWDPPNPGIEPWSPTLQGDASPAKPQGKPKNTGVCSLSLLQQIFLTQELNWGLLQCRQILYQLSYEGSHLPKRSLTGPYTVRYVSFYLGKKILRNIFKWTNKKLTVFNSINMFYY